MKRITNKLIKFLLNKNLYIAFAESMSCGLVTHQLNTVKGTSEVLKGSVICYSEEVKRNLLKVPATLIAKHTAESQQVTDALAKNLKKLIKADVYAAITGLAAPGGSECKTKPVGTVFYSVYYKNKLHRERKILRGTPSDIKKKACKDFYKFIYEKINE
jgi:nicotinamide-nucleotide amidase